MQAEIKADLPEADCNDEEDAPCLVPIEVGVGSVELAQSATGVNKPSIAI